MLRLITAYLLLISVALASETWDQATSTANNEVYLESDRATFYCGCAYSSREGGSGSGSISDAQLGACGYVGRNPSSDSRNILSWEHVVPFALMPVYQWACNAGPGGSRRRCERNIEAARPMIFDLHNIVPSILQVNQYRSDNRYADLPDNASDFGVCEIEDTSNLFEPPDCHKGDVARIWFYMHDTYGVHVPEAEWTMFVEWSELDPISSWEVLRERRIYEQTGNRNYYVYGTEGNRDRVGLCDWEFIAE